MTLLELVIERPIVPTINERRPITKRASPPISESDKQEAYQVLANHLACELGEDLSADTATSTLAVPGTWFETWHAVVDVVLLELFVSALFLSLLINVKFLVHYYFVCTGMKVNIILFGYFYLLDCNC